MIGKIIIIGIIVVTLAILGSNSSKIFSNPSLEAIKTKIDHATSDKYAINATNSTIKEISMVRKLVDANSSIGLPTASASTPDNITPTSIYQLSPKYVKQQNYTGQVFEKTGDTCSISVPAMAQAVNGQREITHIIQLGQCSLNVGDPVQIATLTATSDAPKVDPSSGLQITPYSKNSGSILPLPNYYNAVHLNMVNQGNNTMLNFEDSSGQTKSVTVTMRNSDTTLFTGTFYSSKFTAKVKDVPHTLHIIEMIIDNTVYGKLHASAYAPSNVQNSTITGILFQ